MYKHNNTYNNIVTLTDFTICIEYNTHFFTHFCKILFKKYLYD